MVSVYNSLHSKNTPIRPTPMITKSPRRSSNCWLNSPCSRTAQIRRLWYTTNYNLTKPIHQLHSISIPNIISLRHDHNKFNLLTSNRPKVTNCILISKSHSAGHCSRSHPNPMKLHRSNGPNNRTWTHLVHIILPRQHQLRTNP